jgi:uncharacterized protein (TIGR03435 family)
LIALFVSSIIVALDAQQPKRTFEVTSVKRSDPSSRSLAIQNIAPGGRFTSPNSLLSRVIQFAYDIRDPQLIGGPGWGRTDRFDITATVGREVSRAEIVLMLQGLLEDRFGLIVRKEQREMPIHALLLDRSDGRLGPNLVKLSDTMTCETGWAQPVQRP